MLQDLRPTDPRLIGPYRLVGQLGDGGMGRVFLGRSAGGKPVAVKVIRSDLAADPDFRARFRREVAAARRVSGLYTAMVVDADLDAPEPWLATAYVAGPSLAEAVREHGPLPLSSQLALAAGLAESLAAIHAAGVVHRDLKPSNVLLGQDGPFVIDFGISRAAEQTSLTRAGFVIGSPGFMSPEQAKGFKVGPASDIFSLGAVLAFAATGDSPFGGGLTAALVYRIVHEQPNLNGVPDEIRPLIERCLAKDPGQRPTASELLAEAEAVQPTPGWLPEPITRTFPDGKAYPVVAASPPPVEEPAGDDWTAIGDSVLPAPRLQLVLPRAEAPVPGPEADAVSPEAEEVPGEVYKVLPEAAAAAAVAQAMAPEARTVLPRAEALAPERETVAPSAEAAVPEGPTWPPVGGAAPAEAEAVAKAIPVAAVVPLAGEDYPRLPRRRSVRSIVLATAAAVIVVASVATGLALSGSSHASSSHTGTAAAVSTPRGTPPSAQPVGYPSASAARTAPHSSAQPSQRPQAQPTTQVTSTQAPTTAPGTVPSTTGSTPKPSPKPKPSPTSTLPSGPFSVSVDGGREDSCGDIGRVASKDGAPVPYTFINHTSEILQLVLIDSGGQGLLQGGGDWQVGQEFTVETNIGAYWVVETYGGSCVAVVYVNLPGTATVT